MGTRLGALCWGAGSASMAAWCVAWITGTFRRYSSSALCAVFRMNHTSCLWQLHLCGKLCAYHLVVFSVFTTGYKPTWMQQTQWSRPVACGFDTCAGAAQKLGVTPKPENTFKVAVVAQGTIVDMLEDVNTGINWVMQKISHYGGDP